jgi:hypothetical protein
MQLFSRAGLPTVVLIALLVLVPACQLPQQCCTPPGTMGQQRDRAAVHDPFPDNDLGPPIVSGRPRGFDRPNSEPKRLQQDNPYARR